LGLDNFVEFKLGLILGRVSEVDQQKVGFRVLKYISRNIRVFPGSQEAERYNTECVVASSPQLNNMGQ